MHGCRVAMHACREAPHACTWATHGRTETYPWCTNYTVRNQLIKKENRPVSEEMQRDISLVQKDTARLHREMYGMQRLMRTPHGDRSRVHEDSSAVNKGQCCLRRSFSRAHSAKVRAQERISCMHGIISGVHATMTISHSDNLKSTALSVPSLGGSGPPGRPLRRALRTPARSGAHPAATRA
jgi:hypothetical protein